MKLVRFGAAGAEKPGLIDADGKVDYRRLEELLARNREDIDYVIRELHMARGAIAISLCSIYKSKS